MQKKRKWKYLGIVFVEEEQQEQWWKMEWREDGEEEGRRGTGLRIWKRGVEKGGGQTQQNGEGSGWLEEDCL